MTKRILIGASLLAAVGLPVLSARAQAPLTVEGITDRNYGGYTTRASFRVPSTAGYSYRVWLDESNAVPTDVWKEVLTPDYHTVSVWRTNLASGAVSNALIQFIIRESPRGSSEDGLPPFTPWPAIPSAGEEFVGAHLKLMMPRNFPTGYEIPVVAWVENDQNHAVRVNGVLQAEGYPSIALKRGVGSGFLNANNPSGVLEYAAAVRGLATNKVFTLESAPGWSTTGGTLSGSATWGEEARILVSSTLTVPASATLTVGAGSVVRINAGVDIYLDGQLVLNGTVERPIVFMPNTRTQPWGGFWLRTASSRITGTGVIFTGSGANPSWFGSGGRPGSHRTEQSLFYCTNQAVVSLTNAAAIWLAGQLGHAVSVNGSARYFFNYDHFLMQGVTSGGEYTDSIWTVQDSAFIDAHLESPPFWQFNDGDEDAIYLVNAPSPYVTGFTNALIGWTRDDGIDSGGSGPGNLRYQNCWFESTYHEGNSLSGVQNSSAHADKDVRHYDGVFFGCGQGLENGYGAVTGRIDHCLMVNNTSGFRFGDNYNWTYYGLAIATNSLLLNNYRDAWGMTWQPDSTGWYYRTNAMDVRSNFLTKPNPYHPFNAIWDPATDGWRLASFMTTPPEAAVGIGFGVWTNQFALSNLFGGAPVGLSTFTTHPVSVGYSFENLSGPLASGTLTFAPGEVLKRIYPSGFDLTDQSLVRVVLRNPVRGELTGETTITYQGSVPATRVSLWVGGTQTDLARLGEGVAVALSGPASQTVSVDYQWRASGRNLATGTLTFAPGQTVLWVAPPAVNPASYELLWFALSNPVGAPLVSPSNYVLVKTAAATTPAPTSYVARGARWNYYDTVTSVMTGWFATNYNDGAWKFGPSTLGYGNSPLETTTVGFGPSSSSKYISTYFRTYFNVTNAAEIASLTFSLLRDDGAVVYFNGAELYRDNMTASSFSYNTPSVTNVSGTATIYNSRTFGTNALPVPLHNGTNVVAVEVHQSGASSSDILMDLTVTGNPAPPPAPPQFVYLGAFGAQMVLGWSDPGYVLETADVVTGPWRLAATNSPRTMAPTNTQQYFRLRK